jgi:hypothetical protein
VKIRHHPEARIELTQSAVDYEIAEVGLGVDFLQTLDRAVDP